MKDHIKHILEMHNLHSLIRVAEDLKLEILEDEFHELQFIITSPCIIGFINLGEPFHPLVDFRLAVDNRMCFNKVSQMPVSFDLFSASYEEMRDWITFIGSQDGYKYSNSFGYLSDDSRPMYSYS